MLAMVALLFKRLVMLRIELATWIYIDIVVGAALLVSVLNRKPNDLRDAHPDTRSVARQAAKRYFKFCIYFGRFIAFAQ